MGHARYTARRWLLLPSLAVALVTTGLGPAAAAGTLMTPGQTFQLSATPPPESGESDTVPAVSGDGQVSAWTHVMQGGETVQVGVRDHRSGQISYIDGVDPDNPELGWRAGNPSLNNDGTRIAYFQDAYAGSPRGNFVTSVLGAATPTGPYPLTGVAGDLPYQHTPDCLGDGFYGVTNIYQCGPKLSADGRAVAYPVHLSLLQPAIAATYVIDEYPSPATIELGYSQALGQSGEVDFGVLGTGTSKDKDIAVAANALPLVFQLLAGSSVFRLVGNPECVADQPCTVRVRATIGACGATAYGRLGVASGTAADPGPLLTEYGLLAYRQPCATPVPPRDCPTATIAAGTFANQLDWSSQPYRSVRSIQAYESSGQQLYQLRVFSYPGEYLRLSASSCAWQAVAPPTPSPTPTPDPTAAPGDVACPLDPEPVNSYMCVVSLLFDPRLADSFVTNQMVTLSQVTEGVADQITFVAAGTQDAIAVRRDANADGNFAGVGDPPAVQVSVGPAPAPGPGSPVDGTDPSLSADGRYVAFTSTLNTADPQAEQVYVHDTDAAGDRTYQSGTTVRASLLPPALNLPDEPAYSSMISGDGRRVVFVARMPPPPPSTTPSPGPTLGPQASQGPRQVWVRDLDRAVTVLASPANGATPGGVLTGADRDCTQPAISLDGSTVSYTSNASNLLSERRNPEVTAVYLRDLGPDFGGPGVPETELVSASPRNEAFLAIANSSSLDSTGGVVVFASYADLLADPPYGLGTPMVYARVRFAEVTSSPPQMSFVAPDPALPSQTITVSNLGSGHGPARVQPIVVTGPFRVVSDGCAGRTLHHFESCQVQVSFALDVSASGTGTATITSAVAAVTWAPVPGPVPVPAPSPQVNTVTLSVTFIPPPTPLPTPTTATPTSASPTPTTESPVPTPTTDSPLPTPTTLTPTPLPVPGISVEPLLLVFPVTGLGKKAPTQDVRVTNTGQVALVVNVVVPADVVDYQVSPKDPAGCAALPVAAVCTYEVTFRPRQLGLRTADFDVIATAVPAAQPSPSVTAVSPEVVANALTATASLTAGPALTTAPAPSGTATGSAGTVSPAAGGSTLSPPASPTASAGASAEPTGLSGTAGLSGSPTPSISAVDPGISTRATVRLAGATIMPTVAFSPTVAQEGRVTTVIGQDYLPGAVLTLTSETGMFYIPAVTADADGSFSVPAVVLRGLGPGSYPLTVTMAGVDGEVTAAPLLVVQGSAQPPDFVSRN